MFHKRSIVFLVAVLLTLSQSTVAGGETAISVGAGTFIAPRGSAALNAGMRYSCEITEKFLFGIEGWYQRTLLDDMYHRGISTIELIPTAILRARNGLFLSCGSGVASENSGRVAPEFDGVTTLGIGYSPPGRRIEFRVVGHYGLRTEFGSVSFSAGIRI